ncbi:MAG: nucleotidyltransferase family protein [Prochlorotrichaceae cyanobacterium]|jgi:predicted nucleotidyltransferase
MLKTYEASTTLAVLENNLKKIEVKENLIQNFCLQTPILQLSFFGSILREDFSENSDIDLLVEFLPFAKIGYFELVTLEHQLSDLLKHKVDLRTPQEISQHFRQEVMNEAVKIYVKN